MALPKRPGSTVKNREDGKREGGVLCKGARQNLRPVRIPGQADDGKYAGFYDRCRVQEGRHGRGRHGGLGQPVVERENRRLYAEAEKAEKIEDLRDRPALAFISVHQKKNHGHEGEGRTAE